MPTAAETTTLLIARYDNSIAVDDAAKIEDPIVRKSIERAIERKASATLSQGISGGSGGGSGITQSQVTAAIQAATNIDGLESLLTTINSSLTTIGTYTDTLEALETAIRDRLLAVSFATDTNQTTANTRLTSIDGKIPALGQALASASVPVVLTAAQLTALSPNRTITSYTASNPTIADTGASVLAANANRVHALIKNRSAIDTVELTFASTSATFGSGVPLLPGETYQINNTNLWTGAISARTASGISVSLSVLEGV